MVSGNLFNGKSHFGIRVPDLVTLIKNGIMPIKFGDVFDEAGNCAVGHNEDASTVVDCSDKVALRSRM